jgi:hypothetical protein
MVPSEKKLTEHIRSLQKDVRNIRFGLSVDGKNCFSKMSCSHRVPKNRLPEEALK